MAQKAKKDRAKNNASTLNNLHIGSLTFNALFLLLGLFYKKRSLVAFLVLSIPSWIAEFVLESTGRPKYDANTRALKSSGEDLAAEGLTEYMFDVIWITWFALVLVILFGNWGWIAWSVVPVYGLYKGYGMLGMAKGLMGGGNGTQITEEQQATAAGNRRSRRAA